MSIQDLVDELKKDLENKVLTTVKKSKKIVKGTLYNIHRRSLPVGFDKPIAFGMCERDATILSTILTRQWIERNEYNEIKYYFDIIRQGFKEDLNVYHNNKELLK